MTLQMYVLLWTVQVRAWWCTGVSGGSEARVPWSPCVLGRTRDTPPWLEEGK